MMRCSPTLYVLSASVLVFMGCGASSTSNNNQDASLQPDSGSAGGQDAAEPDAGEILADAAEPEPDAGQTVINVPPGNVSGAWCGMVTVLGSVTVPAAETLEICGGSTIDVIPDQRPTITVNGTLRLLGDASNRITMGSTGQWIGIVVNGTLEGAGLDITGASRCIDGAQASSITLDSSVLSGCGQALRARNGGTFTRTTMLGGNTVTITGGVLRMTDSVIDLRHAEIPPDCTDWAGGGAELDHVRFTGCHCPLHFNSTTSPITVTNSVFDDAANSVMIANTTGTFTGNNFISSEVQVLDIGGRINANVAGNFWSFGTPTAGIGSANRAQFTGTDDYAATPFPEAGPR